MSSNSPSPRDLDPKFQNAKLPADVREGADAKPDQDSPTAVNRDESSNRNEADKPRDESAQETLDRLRNPEIANDPDEGQIVHRVQIIDPATGQPTEKVHGPMPVGEWADYSAKNGL